MPKIQDNIQSKLLFILKIFVLVLCLIVLFRLFLNKYAAFEQIVKKNTDLGFKWIYIMVLVLVLSIFNWFGEIKKWQYLVGKIDFKNALWQSLVGHFMSMFTPNKWGEFGGKCLFYHKDTSTSIIALTTVGQLSQLFMTIIFGGIGLVITFNNFDLQKNLAVSWPKLYLLSFCILPIFLSLKSFRVFLQSIWYKIKHIRVNKLKYSLYWSCFRYFIFSHQFYLLLVCFNKDINYWITMPYIAVVYLFSSVLPALTIADFVVKGTVAGIVLPLVGVSLSSVVITVFLMWLGNVFLPSIIGYIYIWYWKPTFYSKEKC